MKQILKKFNLWRSKRGVKVIINCRDPWLYDTQSLNLSPTSRLNEKQLWRFKNDYDY